MQHRKILLLLAFILPLSFLGERSSFANNDQSNQNTFPPQGTTLATDTLSEVEQLAQAMLNRYFMHRYRYEGFNGSVLISHNGKAIYYQNFGYADIRKREQLTNEIPFELASVSKTFTGTAVLKLIQAGKMYLDDPVKYFFPDFPYEKITLRHLLCHRSGLPDYLYLDSRYIKDRSHYMDNEDVVHIFTQSRPSLEFYPNTRFHYSNTNYALLAQIVSVVTGQKFQDYMRDSIFLPLGMTHSFVFDFTDTVQHKYARTHDARGNKIQDVCFDGVVGDKGIFSTAADMLKWDNALREGRVLTPEMLQEAYTPRSFERYSFPNCNVKNYGYGWRLQKNYDGSNIVYHNGYWHGNNNVFARNLRDKTTIIVLGNKLNQGNYSIEPVWNILKILKQGDAIAVK